MDTKATPSKPFDLSSDDQASRAAKFKEETRVRLSKQFGIESDFVRVPILSKILGISSNAIYSQMSRGTFPIVNRRVGNVVLIPFADLLDWYCSVPACPHQQVPEGALQPVVEIFTDLQQSFPLETVAPARRFVETREERYQRIKQEVIAEIKAKHRGVRR